MKNDDLKSNENIPVNPQSLNSGDEIDDLNAEDIINYSFEIETSTILEAIENKYSEFERKYLIKLRNSLNEILQKERKDPIITYRDKEPGYFERLLYIEIPAQKKIVTNPMNFPIPNFFVGNTRKNDVITILETHTEIILKADHKYFNQFFAFRLATLDASASKRCQLQEFYRAAVVNLNTGY